MINGGNTPNLYPLEIGEIVFGLLLIITDKYYQALKNNQISG